MMRGVGTTARTRERSQTRHELQGSSLPCADDLVTIAADHVEWVREQRSFLGSSDEIDARLRSVEQRLASSTLRIAVFGEFSSGKSTLLNALLGKEFLPTSAMVTTSIPTELHSGSSWTGFRLELSSGSILRSGEGSFRGWFHERFGDQAPERHAAALKRIMHDEATASLVQSLELHHTETLVGSDVLIVDTPGFNSTSPRHRLLAESVARTADLAVILVPASTPVSMAMTDFLSEVLWDYRQRSVFIITKGRLIADEIAEVHEHAARRLADAGFAASPVLRSDAADVALAELDPQRGVPAASEDVDPAEAVERLGELGSELSSLAARGRETFIADNTQRLLADVLEAVAATSAERRSELEQMRVEHEALSITEPEEFLLVWLTAAQVRVADVARDAARVASRRRRPVAVTKAVDRAIDSLASSTNDAVFAQLERDLEGVLRDWVVSETKDAAWEVRKVVRSDIEKLERRFRREYASLEAVAGVEATKVKVKVSVPTPRVAPPKATLGAVLAKIKELEKVEPATRAGAAGVFGAIGALFGGPIGLAIGAGIGALISGEKANPAEVRKALEPVVESCVDDARRTLEKIDAPLRKQASSTLAAAADAYQSEYGPEVWRLIDAEDRRRERIESDLEVVGKVLAEAQARRKRIGPETGGAR